MKRWEQPVHRRKPFHERYEHAQKLQSFDDYDENDESEPDGFESDGASSAGEEAWRSSGGDRLRDFGVDEDAEFYDEDNIPLAELIRRRKGNQVG